MLVKCGACGRCLEFHDKDINMKKLIQEELELERALNVGRVRGVVSVDSWL